MRQFTDIVSRRFARLQRKFERARPGSVLIFVIALLVLLALMGTAYLATARLDRYAAATGSSSDDINREAADALQAGKDDAVRSVQQDLAQITCPIASLDPNASVPSVYVASRANAEHSSQ